MHTVFSKPDNSRSDWYLVDAAGKTLGRLASQIAHRLKGKHKPNMLRIKTLATTSSSSTRGRCA